MCDLCQVLLVSALPPDNPTKGDRAIMNEMMGDGMMWGMGLWWILAVILLILGIAALAKYLLSRR